MSNAKPIVEENPLENSFIRFEDRTSRKTKGKPASNSGQALSTIAAIERGEKRAGILFGPNVLVPAIGEDYYNPIVCEKNVDIFNPFKQGV